MQLYYLRNYASKKENVLNKSIPDGYLEAAVVPASKSLSEHSVSAAIHRCF